MRMHLGKLALVMLAASAFLCPHAIADDPFDINDDPFSMQAKLRRYRETRRIRDEERRRREDEERRRIDKEEEKEAETKTRSDTPDKPDFSDHDDDVTTRKRIPGIDNSWQFNKFDFEDTDFSKNAFDSLDKEMRKFKDDMRKSLLESKDDDKDKDKDVDYLPEDYDPTKLTKRSDDYKDFSRMIKMKHEMPGDWVPSKLDPLNNGGFTISDDNGAPVPYKLNGHVDFQREPAWTAAD